MDCAALDGAGPDNGDLDDDVLEAHGLEARQHLLLGAAFHLKRADSVPALEHLIERGVVERQGVQIGRLPAEGLDVVESLGDEAERTQRQEVDFDQAGIFDAVFVPLADDATGHGGGFERDDLVQGRAGDEHAAGVDGEMARAAVDLAQEIGEQSKGRGDFRF